MTGEMNIVRKEDINELITLVAGYIISQPDNGKIKKSEFIKQLLDLRKRIDEKNDNHK